MRELISEVDAHDARPPSVADALAALRESTAAALRLIDLIAGMPADVAEPFPAMTDGHGTVIDGRGIAHTRPDGSGVRIGAPTEGAEVLERGDDAPTSVAREDRWIGTGEPAVEPPPAPRIEGAMPPDHCGNHRDHLPACGRCIAALEAQDTWRSSFANRAAAARAEVAREAAEAAKPLPPGRQAFRAAKAEFDAKRERATDDQKSAITVILNRRGVVSRAAVLDFLTTAVGRPIESRNDLTRAEASSVIDRLSAPPPPDEPPADYPAPERSAAPASDTLDRSADRVDDEDERRVNPPPERMCGRCGHDHDGECQAAVVDVEDGDEVVMPCGCPSWVDEREPADVVHPTIPIAEEPLDVDGPSPAVGDGGGDPPAAESTDLNVNPNAWADDGTEPEPPGDDAFEDEFRRDHDGWRDYDNRPLATAYTGGPDDEPIF